MDENSLPAFLDLMDSQRIFAFSALDGLADSRLWQRPASKEWSIGEILDHNMRLYETFLPLVKGIWKWLGWYGERKRTRPYSLVVADVYRRSGFPHWVGFLWPPKHTPEKPVSLAMLRAETEAIHTSVRTFFEGKDPDVLGNLYLYDPIFGWCNLITTLRIGVYHDQLHYDDALKQAQALR